MKIIYQNESGGVSVIHPTGELSIEEVAAKDVPEGVAYEIVEDDAIPSDRTFRAAWVYADGSIEIDLDRAKAIGHDLRRANRNAEFAPHDRVISLKIPGTSADQAEAARAAIRERYSIMQTAIDAAKTVDAIHAALN